MKISLLKIIIGIVSLLVGLFFTLSSWWAYLEYKSVQDYGGRAIGHITKKHFQTAADEGGNYYLDYEFMPSASSKISASSMIAKQQWDMFHVGDTMEIRFDRSNPQRNVPMSGGSPSLIWSFFMLAMGLIFMVFGVSRFLTSFKKQKSSA